MLKINQTLIIERGLPFPLHCNAPAIATDNASFINNLVLNLGVLPINPPFELHPYKQDFQLQSFDKYIIGTFPPISYVLDNEQIIGAGINFLQQPNGADGHQISAPWIPFYHGNQGSMWSFLLANQEMTELEAIRNDVNGRQNAKNYLINFLLKKEINYADIIDNTQRNRNNQERYDGTDTNLNNICSNNELICHILSNPKAKYLLFNTSSIFSNAGIRIDPNSFINVTANTKSFDLFVRQCQELGLEIQIRIQLGNAAAFYPWTNISALTLAQRRTKFAFEMKIKNPLRNQKLNCDFKAGEERIFTLITPFSPAAVNRGQTRKNKIVQTWLLNNIGQPPSNMLNLVYQNFRNNNLSPIYEMNV